MPSIIAVAGGRRPTVISVGGTGRSPERGASSGGARGGGTTGRVRTTRRTSGRGIRKAFVAGATNRPIRGLKGKPVFGRFTTT